MDETSVEALMAVRENLLDGLSVVGQHVEAGTFKVSKKEGSAPPSQSGWLTIVLLLGVEDELESRVLGFQRALDPNLIKVV